MPKHTSKKVSIEKHNGVYQLIIQAPSSAVANKLKRRLDLQQQCAVEGDPGLGEGISSVVHTGRTVTVIGNRKKESLRHLPGELCTFKFLTTEESQALQRQILGIRPMPSRPPKPKRPSTKNCPRSFLFFLKPFRSSPTAAEKAQFDHPDNCSSWRCASPK